SYHYGKAPSDVASITFNISPGSATPITSVEITKPLDGADITEATPFNGVISGGNRHSWQFEYRPVGGAESDWVQFASGGAESSVAATLDPKLLVNGLYEVRLSATDTAGNEPEPDLIYVQIKGSLKTGTYNLSYVDLTIPV